MVFLIIYILHEVQRLYINSKLLLIKMKNKYEIDHLHVCFLASYEPNDFQKTVPHF